ncbi:hypothetical protein [Haliangium sp.]|uniref:hypothetical protein n=1 Tax=Haliangium sp. TaxID=2663208 RepID=UPI003D10B2C9
MDEHAGSQVAGVVRKHAALIADILERLAGWDAPVLQAIQDKVAGGLHDAGVSLSTARTVGFWVRNYVDWVLR